MIKKIDLSQEKIDYLEAILRQPTSEARVYVRAKILLFKPQNGTRV